MRKFTKSEKNNGEVAVRGMSEQAQAFYNGTSPLEVYEYLGEDAEENPIKLYAFKLCEELREGLTLEELEHTFEDINMA